MCFMGEVATKIRWIEVMEMDMEAPMELVLVIIRMEMEQVAKHMAVVEVD